MTEDRPVQDEIAAIQALRTELEDLKSTMLARLPRRPTGDIEPAIRGSAKDGTLVLNGQVVARATHPALWAWAQAQGLVVAGLFTVGDGSTTFGLPDFRDRVPVGAGALAVGALVGTNSLALAVANLPPHSHTVDAHAGHFHAINDGGGTNSGGSHFHAISDSGGTDAAGSHGGHVGGGGSPNATGAAQSSYTLSAGSHNHRVDTLTSTTGSHDHGVYTLTDTKGVSGHVVGSAGSGTAIDNRQASIAVNWLIWT